MIREGSVVLVPFPHVEAGASVRVIAGNCDAALARKGEMSLATFMPLKTRCLFGYFKTAL